MEVGQKVRVLNNRTLHDFKIGEVVECVDSERSKDGYEFLASGKVDSWFMEEDEYELIKHYKFVGTQDDADEYEEDLPKLGKVYSEFDEVGGCEVKHFATNQNFQIRKEWELAKKMPLTPHYDPTSKYYLGGGNITVGYDSSTLSNEGIVEQAIAFMSDTPSNPSHYKNGKVECWDAIESAVVGKKPFEAVQVANVIKYLWRYEEKGGVNDIEKALVYLNKLLKTVKDA